MHSLLPRQGLHLASAATLLHPLREMGCVAGEKKKPGTGSYGNPPDLWGRVIIDRFRNRSTVVRLLWRGKGGVRRNWGAGCCCVRAAVLMGETGSANRTASRRSVECAGRGAADDGSASRCAGPAAPASEERRRWRRRHDGSPNACSGRTRDQAQRRGGRARRRGPDVLVSRRPSAQARAK